MPTRAASLVCLVFALSLAILPSTSHAQEPSPSAAELAKLVVENPTFRGHIAELMNAELATRTKLDFANAYLERVDGPWAAIEADLAARLEAGMSPEEIETAVGELRASDGGESPDPSERILDEGRTILNDPTESRRQMAILGCTAGVIAPNIEAAFVQAGKSADEFAFDDEFFEMAAPILASTDETCTCVIDKTFEKFGDEFLADPEKAGQEPALYAQQLVGSGECPNPFAGVPQGDHISSPCDPEDV